VRVRPWLVQLLCCLPLFWLAGRALVLDDLGANPIEAVVRFLGDWALRFVVIVLAVTPLRQLAHWPSLARYRRMLGLWAFAFASLHMSSYVILDQFFDWATIANEIIKHKFITVGMAAFILLLPLALTSTNGMIKRLGGRRWRALHRLVYLIGPLAVVHYVWMVKADIRQPLVYGGLVALSLGYRLIWRHRAAASLVALTAFGFFFTLAVSGPVFAQTGANALGCFTKAEQAAEQIVREGLRLREAAQGCDRLPWRKDTKRLWDDINQRFGQRLAAQTQTRQKAFQREFGDDAENRLAMWDGRIVTTFRHYPLSDDYCDAMKETLESVQKKGWSVIDVLARKGRVEVEMDYRPCNR